MRWISDQQLQEFLDGVEPFLSSPADRVTVRASRLWKCLRELRELRATALEQDARILELLLLQGIDDHLQELVPLGDDADPEAALDVLDEWLEDEPPDQPDQPSGEVRAADETPARPLRRLLGGDAEPSSAAGRRCHTGEWLRPSPSEVEEFDPTRDD